MTAATLVNDHRVILDYLLTSAVSPRVVWFGVAPQASEPDRSWRFLDNWLADHDARSALKAWLRALPPNGQSADSRPHVTAARVLEIAARFFYPARIIGDTVQVYRCVGINGVSDLGSDRDIPVEAFAFAAVLPADSSTQLDADVAAARQGIQRYARQGSDTVASLKDARIAMYGAMAQSAGLLEALRSAYQRAHGELPFHVQEWEP